MFPFKSPVIFSTCITIGMGELLLFLILILSEMLPPGFEERSKNTGETVTS